MNAKTLMRGRLFALGTALIVLTACKSGTETHAGWSYEGKAGPAHWAELKESYSLAATGKAQSPIDISSKAVTPGSDEIEIKCSASVVSVVNNGHSIQADVTPGATLETPTGMYMLHQFHFHSPSEHTYNGKHAAVEMHMVHIAKDGSLAVVGVMIEEGAKNDFFDQIWSDVLSDERGMSIKSDLAFSPAELLPESRAYYRYSGSLTTPPCSEGVDWIMMQTPLTASAEQIAGFREAMYHNNRPTQPLNGRAITSGK